MDATELRITAEIEPNDWAVRLCARSDVVGEVRVDPIPLPFSEADLSLVERALDLNSDPHLTHPFSAPDVVRLKELRLLRQPWQHPADAILNGDEIRRDTLRERVRSWLVDVLIEPLAARLDQHFSVIAAQAGGGHPVLHLRLEMWPGDLVLFRLPWELLHGHRLPRGDIHIGRYILCPNPSGLPPPASALCLLVLQADPVDQALPRLFPKDRDKIAAGLAATAGAGRFDIVPVEPADLSAFQDTLLEHAGCPTIVHFAGHGDFGWRCGRCEQVSHTLDDNPCGTHDCGFERDGPPQGLLAFKDSGSSMAAWIGIDGICDAMKLSRDLRLVVLNACKTAVGRRGPDVFNGMAQRLMDVVPAVIAAPYPLETHAAEEFARCFYRALANGLSLVESLHQVRLLMADRFPDEWYRPVLYLRANQADGGRLVSLERDPGAKSTRAGTPVSPPGFTGASPSKAKTSALGLALRQLEAQYEAAMNQSVTSGDAVIREQAAQQAEAIERRMDGMRRELSEAGIGGH